eukprot:4917850-Pleurochrysis_carterae.AAC.2
MPSLESSLVRLPACAWVLVLLPVSFPRFSSCWVPDRRSGAAMMFGMRPAVATFFTMAEEGLARAEAG